VLDFSRMESGDKKYNFRDADLLTIVRETVETYRPHLENCGFELEYTSSAGTLPIHADTDAIAQVVVNLISNAEKYSNGEKTIVIAANRRDAPLPYAEVQVLDRGPGVPRGSEEKVFEKFYRAHDSLSSGIQGSGLSLTLARQIACAHGGDVAYEPREGGGSCFALRLPLRNEPAHS
jgi:signal transduction histidine kinase